MNFDHESFGPPVGVCSSVQTSALVRWWGSSIGYAIRGIGKGCQDTGLT